MTSGMKPDAARAYDKEPNYPAGIELLFLGVSQLHSRHRAELTLYAGKSVLLKVVSNISDQTRQVSGSHQNRSRGIFPLVCCNLISSYLLEIHICFPSPMKNEVVKIPAQWYMIGAQPWVILLLEIPTMQKPSSLFS